MQVLRETRAKIDPVLLAVMKDKISKTGLAGPMASTTQASQKSVFSDKQVEALTAKKPSPKTSASQGAGVYAAQAARPSKPDPSKPETEPVDRQKIAAIVMEYMRLREEKKPGH